MEIVALIPARGGSKGIPQKNLAPLHGLPLIAWTIEAARKAQTIRRIVVSTDSSAIADVAREFGAETPFVRPAELAGDDVSMLAVVRHAVEHLGDPDLVVVLQPTAPLRRADHIDAAVGILSGSPADSAVSVVEVPHAYTPGSIMRLDEPRLIPFLNTEDVPLRQLKPTFYARNGPAIIVTRSRTIRAGSLYGEDCRPYLMGDEDSVDIDTPFDLALAEWLLSRRL